MLLLLAGSIEQQSAMVAKIFFFGGGGGGGGVERYGSVDSRVPRSLAMENEWGTLEF